MAEKISDFRDLYVMASPGHDSLHVVRCDDAEGGFRDFINKNIDRTLQTPMVPDNWLLHYRLPENAAREIPELAERSGRDYFRRLAGVFSHQGIAPQNIVRLRDAVFCREKKIPLLGFDAEHIMLAKRPDYLKTQQGYGAYLPELQGVLLFSRSDKGDKLLGDLLQYHFLHFFDPELKEKSMGVYQLPLFDPSLKSLVDRCTPHVTRDNWQNTRMQGLPQEIFAAHSALSNGVLTKGYDFSPTWKAYARLSDQIRAERPYPHENPANRNICDLLYIRETGLGPGEAKDQYPQTFKYADRFLAASDRFSKAVTNRQMDEALLETSKIAATILDSDFANRRRSAPGTQQQSARPEVRHIPSVAPEKKIQGIRH